MSTNEIIIRLPQENDYKAVNELYRWRYCIYSDKLPNIYKKTPTKTLPKGTFLNILEDNNSLMILAECNKIIAGVLSAEIENDDGDSWTKSRRWICITELSVPDDQNDRKIETMLLKELEKWAKKMKISEITTLLFDYEKPENSFFVKNGYSIFGDGSATNSLFAISKTLH